MEYVMFLPPDKFDPLKYSDPRLKDVTVQPETTSLIESMNFNSFHPKV